MKALPLCRCILFSSVLLAACTALQDVPLNQQSQNDWVQYQLKAAGMQSWHLHGRAAIFVDDEVHNIGLNWRRHSGYFVMTLEAPFRQGVIRLESDNHNGVLPVKLSLPDGRVLYGDNAEATLYQVTGWSIPVSGLAYWIKGLPQKNQDFNLNLNGDGRPKALRQHGWLINYLDYFDFEHVAKGLPRKMYLKRENLALKIVIDSWQRPEVISGDSPELFPDFN